MSSISAFMIAAALLALRPPTGEVERPIVIGLFESGGSEGRQLVEGAEAAVARVNADGGVGGRPLELLRLATPGPWRDVASRMARAVFEEELVAVVGPADRRGAHLAAQIVTRKRVPLLALSAEERLTQVKDPWVYQGVPDDREQALALLRWAFADPEGKTVNLVVPGGRDGEERLEALEAACASLGVATHRTVLPEDGRTIPTARGGVDATLLWLDPAPSLDYLARGGGQEGWLLASTRLDQDEFLARAPEGCALPSFRSRPAEPGVAALAHDMILAVARSAREGDASAETIRGGLADGITISGESGEFRFDRNGRRQGTIPIWTRQGGVWIRKPTRDPRATNGGSDRVR